jgi:hypothetical protein
VLPRLLAALAALLPLLLASPVEAGDADALADDLARELEREMGEERAAEGASYRPSRPGLAPCVRSEAELPGVGEDVIRHRRLGRDDFRSPHNRMRTPDPERPGDVAAHVGLFVACTGRLRLEQRADGRWEAWLDGVRFYALLDRRGSWWDDDSGLPPEWVLRHEQGHFDLAELVVRRHNAALAADGRAAPGVGASDQEALAASDRLWAERLERLWSEFLSIERRYDLETHQGPEHQTRWFERIQRELAATRARAD